MDLKQWRTVAAGVLLFLIFQLPECSSKILATWGLENMQAELWHYSQKVVEDIGLDSLVRCPSLVFTKHIDFEGQTLFGGLKLPYQKGHILMDHWVGLQILFNINPERTNISKLS